MRLGRRPVLSVVAGFAAFGMLLSGCGAATNSLHPGRETVTAASLPKLGTVLVDGEGQTIYEFAADPPGRSTCYGACASIWPPVTTEAPPRAGQGVPKSKLSAITRRDGRTQLAYNGQPLYYYQADTEHGDAYGEGLDQFGARWYVVFLSGP
jgi:predicted lipoprotein with Yx(FWY)xxD motif